MLCSLDFCMIISAISGIAAKLHEAKNGEILQSTISLKMGHHLLIIPIITAVILVVGTLFSSVNDSRQEIILVLVISLCFAITPALVIYRADELKSHVYKVLKNKFDEAFLLSIYVTPTIIFLIMYLSLYVIYEVLEI